MPSNTRLLAAALVATAGLAAGAAQAQSGAYHLMPMPADREAQAALARASSGPVNYYGGSVFSNVRVVSVMWGKKVPKSISSVIPAFSAALVNSSYIDQLSQYSTHLTGINGVPGTDQTIARGTYFGQVVIQPKNTATTLTDAQVQAELQGQIAAGKLPANDLNTLYMVYFPSSITITLDGSTSCQQFGAYHEAVDQTMEAGNLFYAVEPDCGGGIGNITFAASHEFAEATTDNIPTPGSNPVFPQAWNNAQGYEIADLCPKNGTLSAGGKSWTVTQVFLNTTQACSKGNYTSP